MYILLPNSDDEVAKEQAALLHEELVAKNLASSLPPWGRLWIRAGKVMCAIPTNPIDEPIEPPLIFIDESNDAKEQVFFMGALAFRPVQAIIMAMHYLQNLVVLAERHSGFWQPNCAPPRLHLREMLNPSARLKTPWRVIPRNDIELLFRSFVPLIKDQAGLKLIAPIHIQSLKRVLYDVKNDQFEQLSLQMASIFVHTMLKNVNFTVDKIELIADYNRTSIRFGNGSKQATLHFLDCLAQINSSTPLSCQLVWDRSARYSSRFTDDFNLDTLERSGCSTRTFVEVVGLQFIDIYLGLWRNIAVGKKPCFGINSDDLGVQMIPRMSWAHD